MPPTSSSKSAAVATKPRDWHALAVVVTLTAGEAFAVWWRFGAWFRADTGFVWVGVPVAVMLAGWWWHIERHQSEYRHLRVRWFPVACQVAAFVGIVAALAPVSGIPLRAALRDGRSLLPLAAAVAWFLTTLWIIAPRAAVAGELLATTAGCAAFGAAVVGNAYLTQRFWDFTSATTIRLVELLLTPFADGPVVQPRPFVVGTETFSVEIEHKCSGFQGIGLVATLLVGYLWWFRDVLRFPQSLLLVPIGVVLIWLANLVRIAALILVGIWISPRIAVDGFHSTAGWIAFVTVGLGTIGVASRMPFFMKPGAVDAGVERAAADDEAGGAISISACVVPFLVLTAVTMLLRAFSSGFDILYPIRMIAVAGVLCSMRASYPLQGWRFSLVPVAIGAVAFAVWMFLAPGAGPAKDVDLLDPGQLGEPWTTLWLLFRVVGATVTVPIAEELFFRGFVVRRLIDAHADSVPVGRLTWLAFVVSSVAFGALHGDAWFAATVVGMLFAGALAWRRSLADAVIAHATTNALLSVFVIATGSWSQWG
jgi:exosortase E/protease (VPEID-CTERM system)